MTHPARHLRAPLALAAACALVAHAPTPAAASFDEFADRNSPKNVEIRSEHIHLTLKGELELELHDLQGEGGPGFDSPTDTRTIGTRSPNVEIDSFWLALRVGLAEGLGVYSVLEFTARDASAGAAWFDLRVREPQWLEHHVELGYHTSIVKVNRRTERYPLIASIYWREPEIHLAYEGVADLGDHVTLELGASLAMMRPLSFTGVQESTSQAGTINVLSYGGAKTFSGNGPVAGGRLRLGVHGAYLDAFGFVGELASEAGTDVLRAGLPNYRDYPGYDAEAEGGRTFWWAGGRLGYDGHRLHALAEAIASQEGQLRRWGFYAQLSYQIPLREAPTVFHTIEPLVRYERYLIQDSTVVGASGRALRSTALSNAVSWDYDILTLALETMVYRDLLRLRLEYYVIDEQNGVPALDVANAAFRNDELLVQAELRF
ncbi:MAG: hypothetical protein CSA66_02670 [Proteobacteria bacterium]|nr:MAG: hypothetical protein CSA66_02670 [Pseudomonadota bacterium]